MMKGEMQTVKPHHGNPSCSQNSLKLPISFDQDGIGSAYWHVQNTKVKQVLSDANLMTILSSYGFPAELFKRVFDGYFDSTNRGIEISEDWTKYVTSRAGNVLARSRVKWSRVVVKLGSGIKPAGSFQLATVRQRGRWRKQPKRQGLRNLKEKLSKGCNHGKTLYVGSIAGPAVTH